MIGMRVNFVFISTIITEKRELLGKCQTLDISELTNEYFKLIVFHLADLLTIEHHKPSPRPKKQESKLGDWYYQDGSVVKDTLQRKGILSGCY